MTSKRRKNPSTTKLFLSFDAAFLYGWVAVLPSRDVESSVLEPLHFSLQCLFVFLLYGDVFTKYSTVTTQFEQRNVLRRARLAGSVFPGLIYGFDDR